jgi:CHASE3 domain sensor protein
MPVTIFWRLISGYLIILLLSVGAASYSIVQLGELSDNASSALNTDNRMVTYEEKLTDVFLSEVRYAGRFIITHSKMQHDQFSQFKNDFVRYMGDIKALAVSDEIKTRLARVEELHLRYEELFDQEVRYIRAGQPYAESRYQQEKGKILDSTLSELEHLKGRLQTVLHAKLEAMEGAARTARTITITVALILFGLGVGCSIVITQSITTPLAQLTRKTAAETGEVFDTAYSHIPEIQELSDALYKERQKIDAAAQKNAAFSQVIKEQFLNPLISLMRRIGYLKEELAESVTVEQRQNFELLTEETERMIQQCAQLNSPPTLGVETKDRKNQPAPNGTKESGSPHRNIHWINYLRRVRTGIERGTKSNSVRGQIQVARYWNTIFHSIKTLGYGKARKQ